MSDIEKKTETNTGNKTDKKTEKVDTAPYMKKAGADNKDVSSKSNFVIPMVLLLVSGIVIVATFYEDEYNALLASSDQTTESAQTEVLAVTTSTDVEPEAVVETIETVEVIEVVATDETKTASTPTATAPTVTETTTPAATSSSDNEAQTAQAQENTPRASGSGYTNRNNSYSREQAKIRAKQHMTMIQQRRQAYEQEMKKRRSQYETAVKTRQERREHLIEAQKAAYKVAHKKHIETDQKLQVIYKKIDELHQEIEQIKREYYSNQRSSLSPMYTL